MLNELVGLKPCPKCGCNDIRWNGYWCGLSLRCTQCGFSAYPDDAFASEDEYRDAWNKAECNEKE